MNAEAHNSRVAEIRSRPRWWAAESTGRDELLALTGGGCNEHGVYTDREHEQVASVGMGVTAHVYLAHVPTGYWIGGFKLETSWGGNSSMPSVWDRAFDDRDHCRAFAIEGLIRAAENMVQTCGSESIKTDCRKLAAKLRQIPKPDTPMPQIRFVKPSSLNLHPQAALVPEMPPDQYAVFLADVKARNLIEKPIEVIPHTDTVIDGRTRLKAALEAGLAMVPVVDADLNGVTPVMYMMRVALLRRHLTTGQSAALAVEIEAELAKAAKARQKAGGRKGAETAGRGRPKAEVATVPQPKPAPAPKSRDTAAAMVNVSPRTVSDAKQVKREAPEVFNQMRAGTVTLAEAKRAVKGDPPAKPVPAAAKVTAPADELAPCPFCGSTRVELAPVRSCVWCKACKALGPTPEPAATPDEAKAAWNKRAKK